MVMMMEMMDNSEPIIDDDEVVEGNKVDMCADWTRGPRIETNYPGEEKDN